MFLDIKMKYTTFISSLLLSYLSVVSGQNPYYYQYSSQPSYYNPPGNYLSSYYHSQPGTYLSDYGYLPYYMPITNATNTTVKPYITQQSAGFLTNATNIIDIYSIFFIMMLIDMIMNI